MVASHQKTTFVMFLNLPTYYWDNILLNKAFKQFKIIYNKFKFQKVSKNINTCGRWCVLRILMMLDHNMDLDNFISFIKTSANEKELTKDELVSYIIS